MLKLTRSAAMLLFLGFGSLYAQTQQVSYVSSTYPLTATTIGTTKFYSFSVTLNYPANLTPSSYISGTQLNSDIQGFSAAYPNPADPPEAILSSIVSSLLSKYPQMVGASAEAILNGTTPSPIPGGPAISGPYGGNISVVIGTFNYAGILSSKAAPAAAAPKPGLPR